ncbi:MAG: hypothetical protein KA116_02100 [Proteobacteria bacterium]|nr:hypothetical protein [Pseudomonadota bacterium]
MQLKSLILLCSIFCGLQLYAENLHLKKLQSAEGQGEQRLPVQTVAFRFITSLSCEQMNLGTSSYSMTNYLWDLLMRLERGDFSYDAFRNSLISQWKTYEVGQLGVGYLPKLQYESKALSFDDAQESIVNNKNPMLPALDRIALIAQVPKNSKSTQFDVYSRRRAMIDELIDDLSAWAKTKNFLGEKNGFKPVTKALCENRKDSKVTEGWTYREKVYEHEKELRKAETDKTFAQRNHASIALPLYKPHDNYAPLSAHTMADRFVKALWCDDFQFLYWEALQRIVNGEFSSKQFKDAIIEHLNIFYNKDWLEGDEASLKSTDKLLKLGLRKSEENTLVGILNGIEVDTYDFVVEPLTKGPVMRAYNPKLPSHLKERNQEDRWKSIFNKSRHYWAMEQKLINWQQKHLLDNSEVPFNSVNAKRRECLESPELKTGKEVYAHLRNNIDELSKDEAKKIEIERARRFKESIENQSNEVAAIQAKIPNLESTMFSSEVERVRSLFKNQDISNTHSYKSLAESGVKAYKKELEDEFEVLKNNHVKELKDVDKKLEEENASFTELKREAYRHKLEDVDRYHGELIEWSGKKFEEKYGVTGFKGACETQAGTAWTNNRVMMLLYREFARDYSDYIIKQNFEDRKSDPEAAAKKLQAKKDQLLKNFRLYFYMACAESDFDPIYVYPYIQDETEASKYAKRYKELSLDSIKSLKAHIQTHRGGPLTKPEANAGIYQKSPDRFYTSKTELAYLDNFISPNVGSTTYDIEQGVIALGPDKKYDKLASLERIKNFCEIESTYVRDNSNEVAEEIYEAITKSGPEDHYELDSLDGASTSRSSVTPEHFKAWAVLNALCPRFSYGMMRATLSALTNKSRLADSSDELSEKQLLTVLKGYFAVVRRSVKKSCSDGNFNGYSLCYDKLKDLASRVEKNLDVKEDLFNFTSLNQEHELKMDEIAKKRSNAQLKFSYEAQRLPEVNLSKQNKLLNDLKEAEARQNAAVLKEKEKIQNRIDKGERERIYINQEMKSSPSTSFGVWP